MGVTDDCYYLFRIHKISNYLTLRFLNNNNIYKFMFPRPILTFYCLDKMVSMLRLNYLVFLSFIVQVLWTISV